jgi:hypothetical protein
MTQYVIVDGDGEEHTEPMTDRDEARRMLEKARREGTLDYSIKRIGRGFM